MDAIAGLDFRSSAWLWAAAAVPLVLFFFAAREKLRRSLANRFVSERLRGRDRLRGARPIALAAGFLCLFFAAAGPRGGYRTVAMEQRESSLVIVVDTSASMDAQDLGTSRLTAAKAVAKRLISQHNGKIGLVVFEGVPQVIAPLTSDQDAVLTLLDSVGTGELNEPGSDLGAAIAESLRVSEAAGNQKADVVVISDGEEQNASPLGQAIDRARAAGVRVSTIMVGTEEGARIPAGNGEYLQDDSGRQIVTVAHPETLSKIASATGGRFWVNPFSERALDSVAATIGHMGIGRTAEENVRIPVERYQWPLAAGFLAFFAASLLNRGAE